MTATRTASIATRSILGALLALVLALRLLIPAGFMPAFERGAVTIVPCPDVAPLHPMAHHHGGAPAQHQPCPYAAASAAASPLELAVLAVVAAFGATLLISRIYLLEPRRGRHDRPPMRGPPLPV